MTRESSAEDTQSPSHGGRPNFPELEREMNEYWEKKRIFERSIEERPEKNSYTFYDGPPFATGLPHYGHLLQSVVKDAIPRYQTMQGKRVIRRWGWDCHGLPIESLIEKEQGLTSKEEVCAFGIQNFTGNCRTSVFRYVNEWGNYIRKLGRWVDMENAYRTLDDSYIESVWWVFAELVKKGLIYKDRRVSLYSPKRATPIANFEVAMDNAYVDHEDPAITIRFKRRDLKNAYFLAWTTTPWTLLSNVALAVHPNLMYVTVRINATGELLTFAESRMNDVLRQYFPLDDPLPGAEHSPMPFDVIERHRGEELQGITYEPLYAFFPVEVGHHVIVANYVSDADGTGIVHIAPTYGEEDFQVGKAHALTFIDALDEQGRFLPAVQPWAGMEYAAANQPIMEDLEARGMLYRRETISHSVAIDPRSKDLLIYRAQPAWYLDVTKLKSTLLETASLISWHPAHFKEGRFGKGLETSPDWCISRTRYWGAPIPVWECETCSERTVISSIKELREKSTPESFPQNLDLHRPMIDEVTFLCPTCGGVMRRVPDVFDCWFESGSMPFAAEHYPFEQKTQFEERFPADFVGEAQDQTRGWFQRVHIISTALMGKPAFQHVIVTGMVLNDKGKKMSKREKNYPDPLEVLDTYGADALRFYLLTSPVVVGEQMNFSTRDLDEIARKVLNLLWNVSQFYKTYAGNERFELAKPRSAHVLDRWIFARLHTLIRDVSTAYETYDLLEATRPIRAFIDDLSTWWLRRSRDRMRGEDQYERVDALKTLREVLLDLSTLIAPAIPFMADRIYQDMEGLKASVHLERWPKEDARLIDERLIEDMTWVRSVVSLGLERRAEHKIPIRQALASAMVTMKSAADVARLTARVDLLGLIRSELNVESIELRIGDDDEMRVAIDTLITPELKAKGVAREAVRHIMATRKSIGLTPTDEVSVVLCVEDEELRSMLAQVIQLMKPAVRAKSFEVGETTSGSVECHTVLIDGKKVDIQIIR